MPKRDEYFSKNAFSKYIIYVVEIYLQIDIRSIKYAQIILIHIPIKVLIRKYIIDNASKKTAYTREYMVSKWIGIINK